MNSILTIPSLPGIWLGQRRVVKNGAMSVGRPVSPLQQPFWESLQLLILLIRPLKMGERPLPGVCRPEVWMLRPEVRRAVLPEALREVRNARLVWAMANVLLPVVLPTVIIVMARADADIAMVALFIWAEREPCAPHAMEKTCASIATVPASAKPAMVPVNNETVFCRAEGCSSIRERAGTE